METTILKLLKELQDVCSINDTKLREQLDLTTAEFDFFVACQSTSRLNCDVVAEGMKLSASRVSRVIDSLVQKGILQRETDPKDRRAIKIALTSKGRRIKTKIEEARCGCEALIKEQLSENELSAFATQLQKITSIVAKK